MAAGRSSGADGTFHPYPPVNDRHVAWVNTHMQQLANMAAMPDATDAAQRNAVAGHIFKLFMLYTTPVGRVLTPDQLKQETGRQKIIAESFIDDLAMYPEWAVAAGIAAFRKTAESKWPPKTPGELLAFVQAEYARAANALRAADRVLEANRLGHNVDALGKRLEDARAGDSRRLAETALEIMNLLEKVCDIFVDPVARGLHDKCHKIFHDWRRANPLPTKEIESEKV